MSNEMLTRVWGREDLDPTTKFVAIALADQAGDEGICWPSVNTIMRRTGLKRRTVQGALAKLEGAMLLRKHFRPDSSTLYIFVLDNLPLIERTKGEKEASLFETGALGAPPPAHKVRPPAQEMRPPRAPDAPKPSLEPSVEPSLFSGAEAPGADEGQALVEHIDTVADVATRWNLLSVKHPGIKKARLPLDAARAQTIHHRSTRTEQGQSIPQLWDAFFERIEASTFLQGREPPGRGRSDPFTMDLTWALKSANFNSIMEGKYGHGQATGDRISHASDGRRMGPAEQATAGALARRRTHAQRSDGRGSAGGADPRNS